MIQTLRKIRNIKQQSITITDTRKSNRILRSLYIMWEDSFITSSSKGIITVKWYPLTVYSSLGQQASPYRSIYIYYGHFTVCISWNVKRFWKTWRHRITLKDIENMIGEEV